MGRPPACPGCRLPAPAFTCRRGEWQPATPRTPTPAQMGQPAPAGPRRLTLGLTCLPFPAMPARSRLRRLPPRRATTVYLVQRRIDMLPKPLTEDICSLR